jgi:hypothetical protein
MFKRLAFLVLVPTLLLLCGIQKASADAVLKTSDVTCGSFTATGTVTQPYVAVRVWNLTDGQFEGGPALIDSYFNTGAPTFYQLATGGNFSFTATFPVQNTGDQIQARVYAAPTNAFGSWDGGAFPQVIVSCAALGSSIPTLSQWMLVALAIVLGGLSLWMVNRRLRA